MVCWLMSDAGHGGKVFTGKTNKSSEKVDEIDINQVITGKQ